MAELICFPQNRNVGKARKVAQVYLCRRTYKGRERLWSETCGMLRMTMMRSGVRGPEIDRQIELFQQAVQAEIDAITFIETRSSDGGPGAA